MICCCYPRIFFQLLIKKRRIENKSVANFCDLSGAVLSSLNNAGAFDAKMVENYCKGAFADDSPCNIPNSESSERTFTMVLPPPNVTGNLHIGHALTVAIEDSICRYNKLLGNKVRWIPGFDHAGIATQTIVEKQIYRLFGKRRGEELSDKEFLDYCENWKNGRITDITKQLNSLGCSLDWQHLFYTMDENFSNAVKTAFCRLHEMGIISREKRLVQTVNESEPTMREQWFLDLGDMNRELLERVENEKLNLDPKTIKGSLVDFLKFEEPWCLSRQLVWGHKIPAYFVENTKRWIVAPSEEHARQKLTESELDSNLIQDPDVLDTWFSSSLIPIVVAGWPDKEVGENVLDLMETGHDIVGFWVAKMLMVCQRLTGHYPFSNILIHGLIRDSQNRKMSKSLGNVVDPMDVIDGIGLDQMIVRMRSSNLPLEEMDGAESDLRKRFPKGLKASGADALRFALLRHDLTDFQIQVNIPLFAEEGRRFCNKVWNMCKYVERVFKAESELLRSERREEDEEREKGVVLKFAENDQEVRRRLYEVVRLYSYFMAKNRPHLAFNHLYKFILCDLCDNYLESTKKSLWDNDAERLPAISAIFVEVIGVSLSLLETFMPFLSSYLMDVLKLEGTRRSMELLSELRRLTDEEYKKIFEKGEAANEGIEVERQSSALA